MEELGGHLRRLSAKKAPGPDGVTNEHLRHYGPAALMVVINATWLQGDVPQEWRPTTIVPIPKAGNGKERVASYRPIALMSHVSKVVERLMLTRFSYITNLHQMSPGKLVGFRAERSVEDNIAHLVQQVQDGWNRSEARMSNSRMVPPPRSTSCWALISPGRTTM